MLDTSRGRENSQDCNEQRAIDILKKYFSLIAKHKIHEAIALLSPNFTLIEATTYTNKEAIREVLAFNLLYNSKKILFKNSEITTQRLSEDLYFLMIPTSIITNSNCSTSIASTVIVDVNKNKILSITIPIENKKTQEGNYAVGDVKFIYDEKFTIKSMDNEISHFLSFLDTKQLTDYFDSGFLNLIKMKDKNKIIDLIEENLSDLTPFITYISLMNKIGEFIEVVLDVTSYKKTNSKIEISATIHDSMNLDDLKILNGQRFSRLTNILENSPTPFFYKDIDGVYLGLNNAYLRLMNQKDYFNIVGKTDYDFLSKEKADFHKKEDLEVIRENKSIKRNSIVAVGNTKSYIYQYTKSPLLERGEVVGIICFLIDISSVQNLNKELVRAQSEMTFIFNNSKLAYFLKDQDLRYTRVNKKFLDNNPYTLEELIGKTTEEVCANSPYGFLSFPEQERKIMETKKPFTISQFVTSKTGKKTFFAITESPLMDDNFNVTGIVGSIEDITISVERQIKLESKYKRTMKLISDEDFLAFIRLDLDTAEIIEYQLIDDDKEPENIPNVYANIMQSFFDKMVYEYEKEEAIKLFTLKNLRSAFTPEGKINCEYTFTLIKNRLSVANIELSFNVNPSSNHRELFIYSTDVTKRYQLDEVIKSITKTGYDFIVKINLSVDICEFIVYDKNLYKFEKNKNIVNIEEFIEILYKNFISDKPDKEESMQSLKFMLSTKDEVSYFFDTKDGRRKRLVGRPLSQDKETYLLSLTDITEITKKDKALQERLKKSVTEAEKANKIKTDFLARMSHDMRTPLNGIMGLADFGFEETQNPEIREYFSKIKLSSNYLLTLLNDVLDMQSIEKGRIRIFPKAVKTEELLNAIETMVIPFAKAKNINFKTILPVGGPEYIYDDSVRISQVLINILNNSIKYTGETGHISYSSEFIGGENNTYKIIISDDGVGMSEEFQKHMFESFTTETNKYSSIEGGTGLGLAICNNLVRLMGGSIECISNLNVGTTFTIYLPTHPISKEEYLEKSDFSGLINMDELKGKKILICEDNRINVIILRKLLIGKGLIVDTAENGKIGCDKVKNNTYDAIFMDIRMPIMNGLEATENIRKFNTTTPIIALSANAYKEDVDKSLESGMDAHLSKPIDKKELFLTLRHYLK
jgi:PAS domain S-box-containing protein